MLSNRFVTFTWSNAELKKVIPQYFEESLPLLSITER